jgi:hypothetical protein
LDDAHASPAGRGPGRPESIPPSPPNKMGLSCTCRSAKELVKTGFFFTGCRAIQHLHLRICRVRYYIGARGPIVNSRKATRTYEESNLKSAAVRAAIKSECSSVADTRRKRLSKTDCSTRPIAAAACAHPRRLADDIDIAGSREHAFRRIRQNGQDAGRADDKDFSQRETVADFKDDVSQLTASHVPNPRASSRKSVAAPQVRRMHSGATPCATRPPPPRLQS